MSNQSKDRFSRRGFHRRAMAALGGALAGGLMERTARAAAGQDPAGKYVDIHVHLTQDWVAGQTPLSKEVLLRWMDERQVAQAVVLPLVSPESWYYMVSNDWVLDQTRADRDRLIPFCDIDPRATYVKGKAIGRMLDRYIEAGAKGLGEHKCGTPIDDAGNLDIFRACSDLKWPVMLHMDTVRNTDEPGLPGLERALQAPGRYVHRPCDRLVVVDLGGQRPEGTGRISNRAGQARRRGRPADGKIPEHLWRSVGRQRLERHQPRPGFRPRVPHPPG